MLLKNILAPENRAALEQFAHSNVLLVWDYDGTLAPIVPVPSEAVLRPGTRRLLTQLSALYPCALLSGRARADAESRVKGTGFLCVVGNHGLEWDWVPDGAASLRGSVHAWRTTLERAFRSTPGVWLEDKRYSLTVHHRPPASSEQVGARIASVLAGDSMLRLQPGKNTFNLTAVGAPDKATAVQRLQAFFRCDCVVFAGDDVTDEDVFALGGPSLLSIRVGESRTSRADYFIPAQDSVDALLEQLIALRARSAQSAVARSTFG